MAEEISQVAFTHKEVAEVLVRHHGLKEGIWGLYVEFGLGAGNIGPPNELVPTAVVPVLKIGLQRFPQVTNLSVDAATINPGSSTAIGPGAGHKGKKRP